MKYAVVVVRTLMGLGFVVFGSNILFPFLPQPSFPPESPVGMFMTVFATSHWMGLIGATQLVGGLLVLAGRTAPLGLVMLAPVLVNIVAFHVFLEGGAGLGPGLVFSAFEVFLIYAYRAHFRGILTTNAKPAV